MNAPHRGGSRYGFAQSPTEEYTNNYELAANRRVEIVLQPDLSSLPQLQGVVLAD